MAGIEPHARLLNTFACQGHTLQCVGRLGRPCIGLKGMGPGACMDLADCKSAGGGRVDLCVLGVDEGTRLDARKPQFGHHSLQMGLLASHIQPAFGGHLQPAFGDKHGRSGHDGKRNGAHFVSRSHFQIQRHLDVLAEAADIVILNVATVLTKVHRDAGGAARDGPIGGLHRIGFNGATSLTNRRNMVNVDADLCHEDGHGSHGRRAGGLYSAARIEERGMGEVTSTLEGIWQMLFDQGERVTTLVLNAVEAFFEHDIEAANAVSLADATVDHVDVEIERRCIDVLGQGVQGEYTLRSILTIVKVNNELERIADCAVDIADAATDTSTVPSTIRVMANSVVGMLRDANTALATRDTALGRRVLSFDDTVDAFKTEVLADAQTSLAEGTTHITAAIGLLSMVRAVERIADHCTNICEQTIYLETGNIVRHLPSGWTDPAPPDDS